MEKRSTNCFDIVILNNFGIRNGLICDLQVILNDGEINSLSKSEERLFVQYKLTEIKTIQLNTQKFLPAVYHFDSKVLFLL
jgi:hypothetical protein